MESGAGGGAGGAISLNVKGVLSGSGSLHANGGHGSISNTSSSLIGGGGSGGRIMMSYCLQSDFVDSGDISALGGLYMRVLPSPSGIGIFEYQYSLQDNDLLSYYIIAAAPGTQVRREYGNMDECTQQSDIFTQEMHVVSWSNADIASANDRSVTALARIFGAVMVDSTDVASIVLRNISNDANSAANAFSNVFIREAKAAVEVTGGGTIIIGKLNSGVDTSMTIAEDTRVYFATDISLANASFTLNGGFARFSNSNHSLSLVDSIFTIGQNSFSITIGEYESSQLHFDNITLTRSRVRGSLINISADTISLLDDSHITATALGQKGSAAGQTDAGGIGAGSWGETGGSGGGHGGYGLDSLNAARRRDVLETVLGSSGMTISLGGDIEGGGATYGDWSKPITSGSGGGATSRASGRGGYGGGVVHIFCSGDIMLSDPLSSIAANGESVYGGGGGGAGGSIYLSGNILYGKGTIRSNGGLTCFGDDCTAAVDNPAGGGGGGRVTVDANVHAFTGNIQAICGCAASENITRSIQHFMGSVTRRLPVAAIVLGGSNNTYEHIDVITTIIPVWPVVTISTIGSGFGDRFAASERDAVVRGVFRVTYKSKRSAFLSSQISAADFKIALEKLGGFSDISVNKNESEHGGWKWAITFHNDTSRIPRVTVDGSRLYSTNNDTAISAVTSYHEGTEIVSYFDSSASMYNGTRLSDHISFSESILDPSVSFGSWLPGGSVFRVFPMLNGTLSSYVGNLTLTSFLSLPSMSGLMRGITEPVLQNNADFELEIPTSIPTGIPTSIPSSTPTPEPTSAPI